MTVNECLNMADTLRPNSFSVQVKLGILNFLESDLKETLFDLYDDAVSITPYKEETLDTELNLGNSMLYISFLLSQYDSMLADYEKYSASAAIFNMYMGDYRRNYCRTRKPKPCNMSL